MSKDIKAFPFNGEYQDRYGNTLSRVFESGMSLHDYFAAKAIQGILANEDLLNNLGLDTGDLVAEKAYMVADAMLKARNK